MEETQVHSHAEEIMNEIILETKKYNEVIKEDKEFSEAKRIRIKIKELVRELKALLLKDYS
jgi:hypothetical protein